MTRAVYLLVRGHDACNALVNMCHAGGRRRSNKISRVHGKAKDMTVVRGQSTSSDKSVVPWPGFECNAKPILSGECLTMRSRQPAYDGLEDMTVPLDRGRDVVCQW